MQTNWVTLMHGLYWGAAIKASLGLQSTQSSARKDADSKLTDWLMTGLKSSTFNRAHVSFSTRLLSNMRADFSQNKEPRGELDTAGAHWESKTAPMTEATIFLKVSFTSSSPGSRGGNYISAGHHWKLPTVHYLIFILLKLWMRPLRLRTVMTCLSGRDRIQIQVCMTPNYSLNHNTPSAFSDKNFSYGWGPWHSICFAINM